MKLKIFCTECDEVLGNWEKEEFLEEEDQAFVNASFRCSLNHRSVFLDFEHPMEEEEIAQPEEEIR